MGFLPRGSKHQGSTWHEGFADCVIERAPSCFEVLSEFQLSLRPRRADLLLLRRKDRAQNDDQGRILRALWPRLREATLVEFKSPSRDFRRSDLLQLARYGVQYNAQYLVELARPQDLTLALVTPSCNQALLDEIAYMGWRLHHLGNGYAEIVGAWYTSFVAFTDQVAEAEQDDFLRIFSHQQVQTAEVGHWLQDWLIMKEAGHKLKDREGYDEMLDKLLQTLPPERRLAGLPPEQVLQHYKPEQRLAGLQPEQRLAGLQPEQRLAGLQPEQRLAGLSAEEQILALSDEVLRGLSDDYIRSLPKRVQSAIRKRLGTPSRNRPRSRR